MPEDMRRIIGVADKIAVVGWSPKEERASNDVASYLFQQGYHIIPVNPNYAGEGAYGETVLKSFRQAPDDVDVVLVFRKSEDVPQVADDVLARWGQNTHMVPNRPNVGAGGRDVDWDEGEDAGEQRRVFWMQLGITNEEVAERMRDAGFEVVQDRCFKIEHSRASGRGW